MSYNGTCKRLVKLDPLGGGCSAATEELSSTPHLNVSKVYPFSSKENLNGLKFYPFSSTANLSVERAGKLFSCTGESCPALKKTSRTFKYKGQWAVRMPLSDPTAWGAYMRSSGWNLL